MGAGSEMGVQKGGRCKAEGWRWGGTGGCTRWMQREVKGACLGGAQREYGGASLAGSTSLAPPPPVPSTPGRVPFVWPQPVGAGTKAPQHAEPGGVECSRKQQGGPPPHFSIVLSGLSPGSISWPRCTHLLSIHGTQHPMGPGTSHGTPCNPSNPIDPIESHSFDPAPQGSLHPSLGGIPLLHPLWDPAPQGTPYIPHWTPCTLMGPYAPSMELRETPVRPHMTIGPCSLHRILHPSVPSMGPHTLVPISLVGLHEPHGILHPMTPCTSHGTHAPMRSCTLYGNPCTQGTPQQPGVPPRIWRSCPQCQMWLWE